MKYIILYSLALLGFFSNTLLWSAEKPPNIVLIFADDLGYADLGCFGSTKIRTPNIDSLAREGIKLTNFHVPQAVCSASRAALLSGCYPNRVGILGALGPNSKNGIKDAETLLPEYLKKVGYSTAIFGKWHLGDSAQYSPLRHGFDTYFGLPYSNDMWPNHPTAKNFPPLPLREDDKVLELNPDQSKLTGWYTDRGVKFIEANKDKPFFLYMPHSMPHVPLYASEKFKGKSSQGLYGDVIEEIDASVGTILETLKKHSAFDALAIPELAVVLLARFDSFKQDVQVGIISQTPRREFMAPAIRIYGDSGSWRAAEERARALMVPLAPLMNADDVQAMLDAVKGNSQIYEASGTPDLLEQMFDSSKSVIGGARAHWQDFVDEMTKKNHGDATSFYSYPGLQTKLDAL
jgi:arylsulfatase A-like enzyme